MTIKTTSRADAEKALDKVDWAAQDALTDDDIARQIADNPDAAPDVAEGLRSGRLKRLKGIDVKAIRADLGMSQEVFAETFGIALSTLRNWEQRRVEPDGTSRALLQIIQREPEAAMRAMKPKAA